MARIPPVTRDAVPQNERAAYDAFSAARGSEPKVGPYSIIAHMPEMAQRLEALRTYLRQEASLAQKLQELVMLAVAREMNCTFMWYAHAAAAGFAKSQGRQGHVRCRHRPIWSAWRHDPDQPHRLLRRAGLQHEHL